MESEPNAQKQNEREQVLTLWIKRGGSQTVPAGKGCRRMQILG